MEDCLDRWCDIVLGDHPEEVVFFDIVIKGTFREVGAAVATGLVNDENVGYASGI